MKAAALRPADAVLDALEARHACLSRYLLPRLDIGLTPDARAALLMGSSSSGVVPVPLTDLAVAHLLALGDIPAKFGRSLLAENVSLACAVLSHRLAARSDAQVVVRLNEHAELVEIKAVFTSAHVQMSCVEVCRGLRPSYYQWSSKGEAPPIEDPAHQAEPGEMSVFYPVPSTAHQYSERLWLVGGVHVFNSELGNGRLQLVPCYALISPSTIHPTQNRVQLFKAPHAVLPKDHLGLKLQTNKGMAEQLHQVCLDGLDPGNREKLLRGARNAYQDCCGVLRPAAEILHPDNTAAMAALLASVPKTEAHDELSASLHTGRFSAPTTTLPT